MKKMGSVCTLTTSLSPTLSFLGPAYNLRHNIEVRLINLMGIKCSREKKNHISLTLNQIKNDYVLGGRYIKRQDRHRGRPLCTKLLAEL